jgi:hypothetical protein
MRKTLPLSVGMISLVAMITSCSDLLGTNRAFQAAYFELRTVNGSVLPFSDGAKTTLSGLLDLQPDGHFTLNQREKPEPDGIVIPTSVTGDWSIDAKAALSLRGSSLTYGGIVYGSDSVRLSFGARTNTYVMVNYLP